MKGGGEDPWQNVAILEVDRTMTLFYIQVGVAILCGDF